MKKHIAKPATAKKILKELHISAKEAENMTIIKKLRDMDKGHPFYSKEARIQWDKRKKELEREELQMVTENRKRYKERGKNGNKEVSEETD